MATLSAGGSFDTALSSDMSVTITTTNNVWGHIRFVPQNAEAPPPSGSSKSFGPGAQSFTVGPFGSPGTIYLDNESGSQAVITYTVNAPTAVPLVATTLTASSTVSGAGFSTYLASPPAIGGTSPSTVTAAQFKVPSSDISGTPGSGTINGPGGRAAFSAGSSSVTITNSQATAESKVFVSLSGSDATLTSVRCTPAAGSFTVVGNAAATATTVFAFLLVN